MIQCRLHRRIQEGDPAKYLPSFESGDFACLRCVISMRFSPSKIKWSRSPRMSGPAPACRSQWRVQNLNLLPGIVRERESGLHPSLLFPYLLSIDTTHGDLPTGLLNRVRSVTCSIMPATLKEFETIFPTLVADLKEHCQKYKLPEQALKWFEQVGHFTFSISTRERWAKY